MFESKKESIPEIENKLSENGKKYRNLFYKLAENRKLNYNNEDLLNLEEEKITNEMETFFIDNNFYKGEDYTKIPENEWFILEKLPSPSDFLYYEEDCSKKTDYKSYISLFPICEYFIKQKSYRISENHIPTSKKSYFGTEILLKQSMNQTILYCMIEEENDKNVDVKIVMITDEDFKKLNDEYIFIKYVKDFPVFKRKG